MQNTTSEVVSIVGGGWSASQVDLRTLPGLIVGVNNAAFYAPRVDVVVSMDRRWSEFRWPWIREQGEAGKLQAWLRRSACKNLPEEFPWLRKFENDHTRSEFSAEPDTLHGTNSGGCALALAYALKPRTVYLFGYDLRPGPKGQGHWYGKNEPRGVAEVGSAPIHTPRYASWAKEYHTPSLQFRVAGIDVVNVSDTSLITAFRKISPREFGKLHP